MYFIHLDPFVLVDWPMFPQLDEIRIVEHTMGVKSYMRLSTNRPICAFTTVSLYSTQVYVVPLGLNDLKGLFA